ncbi:MAG: DNA-directed RNA polymerase subunit beta', partial [Deltaproteobacteria bacterium]|nr:DNA-directed RNA polymerase subunit beta' [Deltaproteobacteria bacterium]
IVSEIDCGTIEGITMSPLVEGGEIIEPLGDRILGRVTLEDVLDPYSGTVILKAGTEINETLVNAIEEAGIEKVKIRSALTCQTSRGVCAHCYGRDLARGKLVNIGEAVGVIAAQAIGEPGTQLTMRTFHIGGAASRRAEQSTLENRSEGAVHLIGVKTVKNSEGSLTVMNRHGELAIMDEVGREREKYTLTYGAKLFVSDGDKVPAKTLLSEWDPYSIPILTEVNGVIKFGDIIDGITMQEQLDEVTGLSRRVIVESKSRQGDLRPRISIKGEGGKTLKLPGSENEARYLMPIGAHITVTEGQEVIAGAVIAKIPRETTKTKDITGGLPRVAELFEARKPKEFAVITEIDGVVSFGKDTKGKRKVLVSPEVGDVKEYLVPKGKHLAVREGDYVKAGEALMDGSSNPHDILSVLGEHALANYLLDEIQEVYRLQGVRINDKHIEVIVRQMLKKVKIVDPGGTSFLIDDTVEKDVFIEANKEAKSRKEKPAIGEPMLLGITKASLTTESFVSAASFQETTKVLTEAAVAGKVDKLRGLKENVIMGRLIPAGTGLSGYRDMKMLIEEVEYEEDAAPSPLSA